MTDNKPIRIIIEGVTLEGRIFRPSDWAERVGGRLASFKNQRMTYSPLLLPGMKDGNRCLMVDPQLSSSHPQLYEHVLEFAKVNHLRVIYEFKQPQAIISN